MNLRRTVGWVAIVAVMLVHLVAGIAGPDAHVCVCVGGVTIDRPEADCCGVEVEAPSVTTGGCTDCHIVPVPDAWVATFSPAPSLPPVAALPSPAQVADIVWPAQPSRRIAYLGGHPPDPLLRRIRTVVLNC